MFSQKYKRMKILKPKIRDNLCGEKNQIRRKKLIYEIINFQSHCFSCPQLLVSFDSD